ncbi:MAG: cell division protein FtsL [Sporomusa sp.]
MLVHKKQEVYVYEQEAASPAPKIVQKVDRRLRVKCLTLVIFAAVIAAATTMQRAAIVEAGYELVKIKGHVAKVEQENEFLRLDIAKLKSPQRIDEIAVTQLGMVLPKNAYFASVATPANSQSQLVSAGDSSVTEKILGALKVNKAEASQGR